MSDPNYLIRNATVDDAEAVLGLMVEHAAYEKEAFTTDGKLAMLIEQLSSAQRKFECLVVEVNGSVQGYSTFFPVFDSWACADFLLLDALFLQPQLRGLGAGAAFMTLVKERARALNCATVRWQTPVFNELGIGFYTKIKADGTNKMFFHWNVD